MDFVVLGFGLGALAVLLGLTVRDLGPFARRIPRDGTLPWSEVGVRVAWGRACRAGGLVVAIAGGALCFLTGIALLARFSDGAGMRLVLGGLVVAVLGFAGWAFRYRHGGSRPTVATPRSGRARTSSRTASTGRASRGREGASFRHSADAEGGRPAEEASPLGALTVDVMGGLRRATIAPTMDDATPASDDGQPTQESGGMGTPADPPVRSNRVR